MNRAIYSDADIRAWISTLVRCSRVVLTQNGSPDAGLGYPACDRRRSRRVATPRRRSAAQSERSWATDRQHPSHARSPHPYQTGLPNRGPAVAAPTFGGWSTNVADFVVFRPGSARAGAVDDRARTTSSSSARARPSHYQGRRYRGFHHHAHRRHESRECLRRAGAGGRGARCGRAGPERRRRVRRRAHRALRRRADCRSRPLGL